MAATLKPVETFRDDFSFSNSPEAIRRFPFPFDRDEYMYSVNIEHAVPGEPGSVYEHMFDVDEHYLSEMAERAKVLEEDPRRCMTMPHMQQAAWDFLELVMTHLSNDYPDMFSLSRDGDRWHWKNNPLGIEDTFTFGDASTLPYDPLEYITRQMQGDFCLLDQRDGDLFMDAGCVTGPADWSMAFDAGMGFKEWHAPVPLAHELGVFERALKFLLNLQVGHPVRRLNWTMTVNPRLDTSPETFHRWGYENGIVTPDNVAQVLNLRVELQLLARLPRSNAIMFSIRTYLISLEELVTNRDWACRLHRVLRDLPQELSDYKGLSDYRQTAVDWLSQFDPEASAARTG